MVAKLDPGAKILVLALVVALLSGVLAKHEHREESDLFPVWAARHAALAPDAAEALLVQVRDVLYAT